MKNATVVGCIAALAYIASTNYALWFPCMLTITLLVGYLFFKYFYKALKDSGTINTREAQEMHDRNIEKFTDDEIKREFLKRYEKGQIK